MSLGQVGREVFLAELVAGAKALGQEQQGPAVGAVRREVSVTGVGESEGQGSLAHCSPWGRRKRGPWAKAG